MLLDPFEKQFDLPPASIKRGDGNRGQGEVVGQKHQPLVGLGVAKSDATQRRVEVLARVKAGEHDGLIANQPRAAVDGMRITARCVEIDLARVTKKLPASCKRCSRSKSM